ncbi:hypothetical protein B0T16DRAFT_386311 [Cercophora newfieldiana]|uniref:DUF7918 domain-containing protein n=1 Tax=Cercophora newfieldiana TaxID=92897 RepID=A0AA40CZY7_9PEZI|nr:hypothetical protein B0T16DRAFT_386311 [Cercophora newfieldiana]
MPESSQNEVDLPEGVRHIGGLEVTIEVDGRTAKEYDPCDDSDNGPPEGCNFHIPETQLESNEKPYVIKYIEAKAGASFQFRVKRLPTFEHHSHHIAFGYRVDHVQIELQHDHTVTAGNKNTTWDAVKGHVMLYDKEEDSHKQCSFRFAALDIDAENTTSPDEMKKQLERSKQVGLLRVTMFHMGHGDFVEYTGSKTDAFTVAPPENQLSEKALKGKTLDTQVTWGDATKVSTVARRVKAVYHDPMSRPFAVFDFRYRSMAEVAQSMNEADARRLLQELLEQRGNQTVGAPDNKDEKPKIKRERDGAPMSDTAFNQRYKARRLESGRFEVDLTDA